MAISSRCNKLVCLDAAAPLAEAVKTTAGGGAHRVALIDADGGDMVDLLTQSAVVARLMRRAAFGVLPQDAVAASAAVMGGAGGGGGDTSVDAGVPSAADQPVVSVAVGAGVPLRAALVRLLRADAATVALLGVNGRLVGKLSPAECARCWARFLPPPQPRAWTPSSPRRWASTRPAGWRSRP